MKLTRTIPAAAAAAALALAFPSGAGAVMAPSGSGLEPTAITAVVRPAPGGAQLTGTLTTAAGPVAGAEVTFTTAGSLITLCSAVTGADGLAACDISQAQVTLIRAHQGIWWARYAGDAVHAPTEHAGHI